MPTTLPTPDVQRTSACFAVVPPGYCLPATTPGSSILACSTGSVSAQGVVTPGSYQPAWLPVSSPDAAACKSCGQGILSDANLDLAVYAPGSLTSTSSVKVAGSTRSCCE